MSGRAALIPAAEIGLPPLAMTKWPVAATSRETNIRVTVPTFSSHATHGAVGLAGFMVPAATRGSSASANRLLLSEHPPSLPTEAAQTPNLLAPDVSSVACRCLPTATQRNPPLAGTL